MNTLEPLNYLDEAILDFAILKSKMLMYSYEYVWNRFIRSN